MNSLQPVSFRSMEDFLCSLPDDERKMVDLLRGIIQESVPNVVERLSYNVPYYYLHSRICFIWPASVPWGKVRLNGVQLGFCNGNLLRDEIGYLDKGTRKQVFIRNFYTSEEIDPGIIKNFIFEAVAIDEFLHKKRNVKYEHFRNY